MTIFQVMKFLATVTTMTIHRLFTNSRSARFFVIATISVVPLRLATNKDGTYAIMYQDGQEDFDIAEDLLKPVGEF